MFCVFSHAYLFPPESTVKNWIQTDAGVAMNRYQIQLSSRRALLNTILALNPDTFKVDEVTKKETTLFFDNALRWINLILKEGPERTKWEEITRLVMIEARPPPDDASSQYSDTLGEGDDEDHGEVSSPKTLIQSYETKYWHKYIFEGIEIAARIRRVAHLSGRYVRGERVQLALTTVSLSASLFERIRAELPDLPTGRYNTQCRLCLRGVAVFQIL